MVRTSQSGLLPDTIGYFGLSGLIPDTVDLSPAFLLTRKAAGSLHRTSKSGLLFSGAEEESGGVLAVAESTVGIGGHLAETGSDQDGGKRALVFKDPLSTPQ